MEKLSFLYARYIQRLNRARWFDYCIRNKDELCVNWSDCQQSMFQHELRTDRYFNNMLTDTMTIDWTKVIDFDKDTTFYFKGQQVSCETLLKHIITTARRYNSYRPLKTFEDLD